jgi:hypothetical protein
MEGQTPDPPALPLGERKTEVRKRGSQAAVESKAEPRSLETTVAVKKIGLRSGFKKPLEIAMRAHLPAAGYQSDARA